MSKIEQTGFTWIECFDIINWVFISVMFETEFKNGIIMFGFSFEFYATKVAILKFVRKES